MDEKQLLERIVSDPGILHGKPCLRGTRIPVYLIISLVAQGVSGPEILKDYPSLSEDDIRAALYYAARLCEYEAYAI